MANEKFYWEKPLWYCRVIVWSNNRRLQAIQCLFLSNWLKTTAGEKQHFGGSSATFAHQGAFKCYPAVSKLHNSFFLNLCLSRFSFIYIPKPSHLQNTAQPCSLALAALYGHWNPYWPSGIPTFSVLCSNQLYCQWRKGSSFPSPMQFCVKF